MSRGGGEGKILGCGVTVLAFGAVGCLATALAVSVWEGVRDSDSFLAPSTPKPPGLFNRLSNQVIGIKRLHRLYKSPGNQVQVWKRGHSRVARWGMLSFNVALHIVLAVF